jgi:hypothetical protein
MFCIMESREVHARGHCVSVRVSSKSMAVRLLISTVLVSKNCVLNVSIFCKGMGFNIRGGLDMGGDRGFTNRVFCGTCRCIGKWSEFNMVSVFVWKRYCCILEFLR